MGVEEVEVEVEGQHYLVEEGEEMENQQYIVEVGVEVEVEGAGEGQH